MSRFTTGETEEIVGLPASTLRFWEKEVPFLAPRKDVFGRRAYSILDICLVARLKHLALDRSLGLQKSCAELEKELVIEDPSIKAEITELRINILNLLLQSRGARSRVREIFSNRVEEDGKVDFAVRPKGP